MSEFLRKHWFYSTIQIISIVVWLWWIPYRHLPWAGVSIAIVAVQAAVMSVHDEMRGWQKFIWLVIIGAFLFTEFRAIRKDRNDAELKALKDRRDQDMAFARVLKNENIEFDATKQGFSTTAQNLNGVLVTTQRVAALANENLENVTGANSFAYVFPSVSSEGDADVLLNVHNQGTSVLLGAVVTIRLVTYGDTDPESAVATDGFMVGPPAITIGSLAPNEGRKIPPPWGVVDPQLRSDGICLYHIWINSQSPGVAENLYFRRSRDRRGFAYKLDAWRPVNGKHKKGDVYAPAARKWIRYLKRIDWTEPRSTQHP